MTAARALWFGTVLCACAGSALAQTPDVPMRGAPGCILTSVVAANAGAQPRAAKARAGVPVTANRATTTREAVPAGEYDIVVDVPNLCVDSVRLVVQGLFAHLALDARVANLARITAGADVKIEEVDLAIRDVRAEALLLVDLDNVRLIVDDLMTMLDNNPEIVNSLVATLGNAVTTAGTVAQTALQPGGVVSQAVGVLGETLENLTKPGGVLTQTINALGQTVLTTFDVTGQILERTLDTAGGIVNERTLGNLLQAPAVREAPGAAGGMVRTVSDTAGNVYEVSVDAAGKILGARHLPQR